MKYAFKLLALGVALNIALIACEKDQENDGGNVETTVAQELILDSTKYQLADGFIINYGQDSGVANFDVNLFTDGLTFTFDTVGLPVDVSGSGQLIYLESWSADTSKMADGTYTLTLNSISAGSVSYGEIITVSNGNPVGFDEMTSFSMQVSVANNVHTLTGSGKTAAGKDFSFSFKKELFYAQDGSFKKKFVF